MQKLIQMTKKKLHHSKKHFKQYFIEILAQDTHLS